MLSRYLGQRGSVRRHTVGMFAIGALVWIVYLAYANILTIVFGVNHFIAESSGIPLSWILNYILNTKYNFVLPFTIKRFVVFCLISGVGWIVYEGTTWLFTDKWFFFSTIGTLVGVVTKTVMNVVMQQAITFGKMAKGVRTGSNEAKSKLSDYDWQSYYHGNPIQKLWKRKIINHTLNMIDGNPVLDIGCGSSPLLSLIPLTEKYGVDVNENKIQFISNVDTTTKYSVCRPNRSLPYPDRMFTTIICNEVIEHHQRPNELIREISRLIKQDGTVIISTPDYASLFWNVAEIFYGLLMHSGYELEHGSKFTETGLVSLCNAYGLELTQSKRVFGCDMVCQFQKKDN